LAASMSSAVPKWRRKSRSRLPHCARLPIKAVVLDCSCGVRCPESGVRSQISIVGKQLPNHETGRNIDGLAVRSWAGTSPDR
jgi:hypothetical protein